MLESNGHELLTSTISELSKLIKIKQVSPVEITKQLLERIFEINKQVNAFIAFLNEEAIESAKQAEKKILMGNWRGALHGIPIGLKDIIFTNGV